MSQHQAVEKRLALVHPAQKILRYETKQKSSQQKSGVIKTIYHSISEYCCFVITT